MNYIAVVFTITSLLILTVNTKSLLSMTFDKTGSYRHTMPSYTIHSQDFKDIPGAFGDPLNVLTALPGVTAISGFYGPLSVRGAPAEANRYYIDGIPLFHPLHIGGVHSVITGNMVSKVDLFSTAPPSAFAGGNAAVISMTTPDKITAPAAVIEADRTSANIYLQFPLNPSPEDLSPHGSRRCYALAAARYGYAVPSDPPVFYETTENKYFNSKPEYYNYQFKAEKFFDSVHSFSILLLGSSENLEITGDSSPPDEIDPLLENSKFSYKRRSHTGGVSYTFNPHGSYENTLTAYASFNESQKEISLQHGSSASWADDYYIKSNPFIYGIKNNFHLIWLNGNAGLSLGWEFTYYDFSTDGHVLIPRKQIYGTPDFSDDDLFEMSPLNKNFSNSTRKGYIKNSFEAGLITVTPGLRAAYLDGTGQLTVDPEFFSGIKLPTETNLFISAGRYSSFIQTNPWYFNTRPDIASSENEIKPERSIHRTAGIEQKLNTNYIVKIELFNNNFYDLYEIYDSVETSYGLSTGKQKAFGYEISLSKKIDKNQNGYYGSISYTYTEAERKTGLPHTPGDLYGDTYVNYEANKPHSLKVLAGYIYDNHRFNAGFEYHSSFPYTSSTGSLFRSDRYVPLYDSKPYSSRFDTAHRLDLRYTYRRKLNLAVINWYVEIINVYNHRPFQVEEWSYSSGTSRPASLERSGFYPNFGVEILF